MLLPKIIKKVSVPPIKCQGIKTKLVPFIAQSIRWSGNGRWIEPFLGSGVVLFNIAPHSALASDANPHIIRLYQGLQNNELNPALVKAHLEKEGTVLVKEGQRYYNEVRERFNADGNSLDFIFLNRACFNGLMRFNGRGKFNVPFGHKPERFRPAYITKIVNQLKWAQAIIQAGDWEFRCANWDDVLAEAKPEDFVYLDPPYIGRHTDYYNGWSENDAIRLAEISNKLPCGYALSMWLENKYRKNEHIAQHWTEGVVKTFSHFYHIGAQEELRNEIQEALVISSAYAENSDSFIGKINPIVSTQRILEF